MRISIGLIASCAIPIIASPIVPVKRQVAATESEASPEATQAKWDNYKWKGRSGKECTGKHDPKKDIIVLPQSKGKRRQDCLDGAMHDKDTPMVVKQKVFNTAVYYYTKDDEAYRGDKRDVQAVDAISDVETASGKGQRLEWGSCSARVAGNVAHIKRPHGLGHPSDWDRQIIMRCLGEFFTYCDGGSPTGQPGFAPYKDSTLMYYQKWYPRNFDGKPLPETVWKSHFETDKRDVQSLEEAAQAKGKRITFSG